MKRILVLLSVFLLVSVCALADAREPLSKAVIPMNATEDACGNARTAAASLDDTLVPPGGSFSFNACIGPRTQACGYCAAEDGTGAQTQGGGIDMAASAVYMAVRSLDCVRLDSLSTYGTGYAGSYVSSGSDAVCTEGADLVFTNAGDTVLTLSVTVSGGRLTCAVYTG